MQAEMKNLFKDLALHETPEQGRIEAQPASYASLDELRKKLDGFPGTGWVCFTEKLWIREDATIPIPTGLGPILNAELCDGKTSLHIRQAGAGWTVTTFTRTSSSGADSWIVPGAFLRSDWPAAGPGAKVYYEVCWERDKQDKNGVYRPAKSRFVGFGE